MRTLRTLGKVLIVASSLQFALFIMEEGLQVLMFSSWAGKDLPRELREELVSIYVANNEMLRALTWTVGIAVPPFFLAYMGYVRAGEVWVKAQIAAYGLSPGIPELWWLRALGWSLAGLLLLALLSFIYASARRKALSEYYKGGGVK